MRYITNLDKEKLGIYKQLKPYIKGIIQNLDYIVEDNRHEDTLIYSKQIDEFDNNLNETKLYNKSTI